MIDLRTTYLGLELKSPIVVSASPLTEELDNIKRMEESGFELVDVTIDKVPAFVQERSKVYKEVARRMGLLK